MSLLEHERRTPGAAVEGSVAPAAAPSRRATLTAERMTGTTGGLRLVGEVDRGTSDVLAAALAEAVEPGTDLHVYLGGLTFIDVAGAAALLAGARELGLGRRMVLHQPPGALVRVLDTLWDWPETIEVAAP